jgi:hypothetical protein
MAHARIALALAGVAIFAAALPTEAAQVFRCTAPGGAVTFQETPCDANAHERALDVPQYPAVNSAERERLLQREAALDARLLKRAEIEAAERVAKEARWAREAELETERQRAKAETQYAYPVYPVYGRPFRPRPTHHPGQSALRY